MSCEQQDGYGDGQDVALAPRYGKYRGVVTDNRDPLGFGRIMARVEGILGDEDVGWALPCLPYAGPGVGSHWLPPVDSWVWIEFEEGQTDYPIWSGCFWGEFELPDLTPAPERKVLKTDSVSLTIEESGGAASLTFEMPGLSVVVGNGSVEISNGKQGASIKLEGNKVSINGNALVVT